MGGRLWTPKEAAAHWEVQTDTVHKWILREHVRSVRFGRHHRIPQAEMDRIDAAKQADDTAA